jgi:D-inositol-3-phosphate glycosyltransferase
MDTKLKLLVVGDGGLKTGFARVLHSIIENLPPEDYDVYHLAINYRGDPFPTKPWHKLYPAFTGGDFMGIKRLRSMLDSVKPDTIFILNDLWIIKEYLGQMTTDEISRTVVYFPVDALGSDIEWLENFELLAGRYAYTKFGQSEINNLKPDLPVGIMPHGVDTSIFFPEEREDARTALKIPADKHDFLVLNANRNQPRKRIDLTFEVFARFVVDKPKTVGLYLHMGVKDAGWDLYKMAYRYGITDRLVLSTRDLSPSNFIPDHVLNHVYNACDIGINTCLGEGWGLPNMEHALTSSVQVVPNSSACSELFDGVGRLIDIADFYTYPETLTVGSVINIQHAVDILNELYEDKAQRDRLGNLGYLKFSDPQFSWAKIAHRWDKVFKKVADAHHMAGSTDQQ